MAQQIQQEEGWPLGLQPMHVRVGLTASNHEFSGSVSFNTLLTGSPTSSTDSSSDLDTESTGSFFHDRSITLGSLIGINSILELSRRSLRGRKPDHQAGKDRKTNNNNNNNNTKFRMCFFSLCSKDSTDGENVCHHQPSLGHFLAAERQAANESYRTNPPIYGPDDELALAEHHQPARESSNSLFVDGQVAPPQSSPWFGSDHVDQRKSMLFFMHVLTTLSFGLALGECLSLLLEEIKRSVDNSIASELDLLKKEKKEPRRKYQQQPVFIFRRPYQSIMCQCLEHWVYLV